MDFVGTVEEFDGRAFRNAQIGVQPADLGVLVGHPFVRGDPISVTSLDHEWPGSDQRGHLSVVERAAEIE